MKYNAAPISFGIKVVTGAVAALAGFFLVLSMKLPYASLVGVLLLFVLLGCYLRAPVAYEYSSGVLSVVFRVGSKQFARVTDFKTVPGKLPRTFRMWGNGGVFAGTGIYWNGQWGLFRAYVTTLDPAHLVLLETTSHKVLISPGNRAGLIKEITAGM